MTDAGSPPEPTAPPTDPRRFWWWYGVLLGWAGDGQGGRRPVFAGPEQACMVLGPPRSGKTTGVIVPTIAHTNANPVVSTSTKADVLLATVERRRPVGRCYVFDPTGTVPDVPGTVPLRWSPLTGTTTFEAAVATAHAMASAARPAAVMTEAAHWVERAETLLAPLLFAASAGGHTMADVCRWVLSHDPTEADTVLAGLGAQMPKVVLASVARTEDRERSGIFSTAAGILAAYRSDAALAATLQPNFDPHRFAASCDTLYICAPAHAQDQLAPLVVALVDQIRAAMYARKARVPNAAPMLFALDEAATIAPLPSLPQVAAEGGGQGVVALVCLQDLPRPGPAGASRPKGSSLCSTPSSCSRASATAAPSSSSAPSPASTRSRSSAAPDPAPHGPTSSCRPSSPGRPSSTRSPNPPPARRGNGGPGSPSMPSPAADAAPPCSSNPANNRSASPSPSLDRERAAPNGTLPLSASPIWGVDRGLGASVDRLPPPGWWLHDAPSHPAMSGPGLDPPPDLLHLGLPRSWDHPMSLEDAQQAVRWPGRGVAPALPRYRGGPSHSCGDGQRLGVRQRVDRGLRRLTDAPDEGEQQT